MATPREKYYTELFRTITDCTHRNGKQFSNVKICDAIHRAIVEEEADAHNITVDNFSQTPVSPNKKERMKIRYWQVRSKINRIC